jgi:hypothetical protein
MPCRLVCQVTPEFVDPQTTAGKYTLQARRTVASAEQATEFHWLEGAPLGTHVTPPSAEL